jgi:hypothetical protein
VRYPALARAFGVSRRAIRLADADETLAITGYVVGAMPPFGHRHPLPTLIDRDGVRPGRVVYGGGGSREALLEITTDELVAVTRARAEPLAEPLRPSEGESPRQPESGSTSRPASGSTRRPASEAPRQPTGGPTERRDP